MIVLIEKHYAVISNSLLKRGKSFSDSIRKTEEFQRYSEFCLETEMLLWTFSMILTSTEWRKFQVDQNHWMRRKIGKYQRKFLTLFQLASSLQRRLRWQQTFERYGEIYRRWRIWYEAKSSSNSRKKRNTKGQSGPYLTACAVERGWQRVVFSEMVPMAFSPFSRPRERKSCSK